jgi:hypothetical protein
LGPRLAATALPGCTNTAAERDWQYAAEKLSTTINGMIAIRIIACLLLHEIAPARSSGLE